MTRPEPAAGLTVRRYEGADADRWDRFVAEAGNGTLLHTRRYLGHHGDRFDDESRIVTDETGAIVGLFPAARGRQAGDVVSHPGLTFGGLVYRPRLRGARLQAVLAAVLAALADDGCRRLDYRPVPAFAREPVGDDDTFALARLGATWYSRGLSSVIDVRHSKPSKTRISCVKKARRLGVELQDDWTLLPAYWTVLEAQLRSRHGTKPVHSLMELQDLAQRFPDRILLRVALADGAVVAGTVCYQYRPGVLHTQYLCSDEKGREASALDLVIASFLEEPERDGMRFFSFGISNDPSSGELNEDLYQYKHSFGASGHSIAGLSIRCQAS